MTGGKRFSLVLAGAVLAGLLGSPASAFAFIVDNSHGEELQLARAYVDVSTATGGGELMLPEITEPAQASADFAVQLPAVSAEDVSAQRKATSSMLWLLVASVLGFSVVARRRSPE